MRRKLLAVAILACAGIFIGTSSASAAEIPCPLGQTGTCYSDPVDFIDTSPTSQNQVVFSDPSNAPQFSVGVGGATSWANPLVITNNPLTDHSRLMFVVRIGGPWANGQGRPNITLTANDGVLPTITFVQDGHSYTLTAGDISFVNAMRAAGITPHDMRMLARWLHATGR